MKTEAYIGCVKTNQNEWQFRVSRWFSNRMITTLSKGRNQAFLSVMIHKHPLSRYAASPKLRSSGTIIDY